MTAKEYLMQVRRSGLRLATLAARMDWIRNTAYKITGSWSPAHTKGDPSYSKVESGAVALADMLLDAEQAAEDCRRQQRDALTAINGLKDERYRCLLELRYISCHQWPEVAEIMQYDEAWVHKLHAEALKALELEGFGESLM